MVDQQYWNDESEQCRESHIDLDQGKRKNKDDSNRLPVLALPLILFSKIIGILAGESSGLRVSEIEIDFLFPSYSPCLPIHFHEQWPRFPGLGFRTAYSDELASDSHGIPRYVQTILTYQYDWTPYKQEPAD